MEKMIRCNDIKNKMGHCHILKWQGMKFPTPKGKMIDWCVYSNTLIYHQASIWLRELNWLKLNEIQYTVIQLISVYFFLCSFNYIFCHYQSSSVSCDAQRDIKQGCGARLKVDSFSMIHISWSQNIKKWNNTAP